jgi:hypothetical protein
MYLDLLKRPTIIWNGRSTPECHNIFTVPIDPPLQNHKPPTLIQTIVKTYVLSINPSQNMPISTVSRPQASGEDKFASRSTNLKVLP